MTKFAPKPRTLKRLYSKLVGHPFFPLLFINEAIKAAVINHAYVLEFSVLAVASTILWAISDTINVEIELRENGIIK